MTLYFDASALVKLAIEEDESDALKAFIESQRAEATTSIIAHTEVYLALSRVPSVDPHRHLFRSAGATALWVSELAVDLLPVTPDVAASAAQLGARYRLRALDAIHTATAHALEESLEAAVTYDHSMAEALRSLGIVVLSPGTD